VDAHQRRLQRGEHQLAGTPGIFEAAACAAMVEGVEGDFARALVVENLLGDTGVDRQRLLPVGLQPLVAGMGARMRQALAGGRAFGVHVGPHAQAANRAAAFVHHAFLVGDDEDVVAAAVLVGYHVLLGGRGDDSERRQLLAVIQPQRILVRRLAAFLVFGPFVHVIATADDAEVTGHVGLLRVDRRQGDAIFCFSHDFSSPYSTLA